MNLIRTFTITGALLLPLAGWADGYNVYPTTPYGTRDYSQGGYRIESYGTSTYNNNPLAPTFSTQPAPIYGTPSYGTPSYGNSNNPLAPTFGTQPAPVMPYW